MDGSPLSHHLLITLLAREPTSERQNIEASEEGYAHVGADEEEEKRTAISVCSQLDPSFV